MGVRLRDLPLPDLCDCLTGITQLHRHHLSSPVLLGGQVWTIPRIHERFGVGVVLFGRSSPHFSARKSLTASRSTSCAGRTPGEPRAGSEFGAFKLPADLNMFCAGRGLPSPHPSPPVCAPCPHPAPVSVRTPPSASWGHMPPCNSRLTREEASRRLSAHPLTAVCGLPRCSFVPFLTCSYCSAPW
jgi:hypothetical protein